MIEDRFKILTLGYGEQLIDQMWSKVEAKTDFDITHLPDPSIQFQEFLNHSKYKINFLFKNKLFLEDDADINYLCELENDNDNEFTIHNIILADEHLKLLPYKIAIKYLSQAAKSMNTILKEVNPDVVISGFEGFHSSLGMLVCKHNGIPWYALVYSSIPKGYTGFSNGYNSSFTKSFNILSKKERKKIAENLVAKFYDRLALADKLDAEPNFAPVYKPFFVHFKNLLMAIKRKVNGNFDPFTHRKFSHSIKDYLRRLKNRNQNKLLHTLKAPPEAPYVFFGIHMQPEMGIDVWAPFFTDQINTIMAMARSIPPSHMLIIKTHKIDADNWSNFDLQRISNLPNVFLAASGVNTDDFIDNADLIFSIQGTIALGGCLRGKNVISFGQTMYNDFSSLTIVDNLNDLPLLVRKNLQSGLASRSEVVSGLEKLLLRFGPGLHNDWSVELKEIDISNFCYHLNKLQKSLNTL